MGPTPGLIRHRPPAILSINPGANFLAWRNQREPSFAKNTYFSGIDGRNALYNKGREVSLMDELLFRTKDVLTE